MSSEETQHALVGLAGQRQGGVGKLRAGVEREQLGAFLVRVGEDEAVSAGVERVDQALGEILPFCTTARFEPKVDAWARSRQWPC